MLFRSGDVVYKTYADIEKDFVEKKLHPMDLKKAVADEIISLLKKLDVKKLKTLADAAYMETA